MSKSLSDLPNYVTNAFHLVPAVAFKPEKIELGHYTFLPWARSGVGAAVTAPANPADTRATIAVAVAVQADGQADLVAKPATALHVRGPGDVIGIDQRQVIRQYPVPGTSNAEDSFLAHIEFDRPELPWLFTPSAPAGDRLPPWTALVVLAAGRYQFAPGRGGLPPQVSARKGELQPLDDSWAWAHAQVVGPAKTGPSIADRLSRPYASVNLSRLICPRRLKPDTQYLACVVPAYHAGVQTGRGNATPGTLGPAWTRDPGGADADETVALPVYVSWQFGTGPAGDFESLAEKLRGVPAPWQVGRRITDVAQPGGGLPPLGPGDPGRLQTVHGPLVSPQPPSAASASPTEVAAAAAETASWPAAETEALRELLNTPERLAAQPPGADPPPDRPVVGPEIYARYHAAQSQVLPARDGDWFGQLNLRPEHRVVAGLGTRVVQKDQEQLMQAAWAQVGPIDDANRQLRWAQMARFVGSASHERHIVPLGYGDLLAATRRVQSRVMADPGATVAAAVTDSHLADGAVTATFRRVTRPLGGLARFASEQRAELGRLVADGEVARDMQRPYRELDGVAGVSALAAAAVDPQRVAQVLGVAPEGVAAALLAHGDVLAQRPSLPDVLTPDAVARPTPSPNFSVANEAGKRLFELVASAVPGNPQREPNRVLGAIAVLAAIAQGGGEAAVAARDLAVKLRHALGLDSPLVQQHPIPPDPEVAHILASAKEVDPMRAARAFGPIAADLVATEWPGTPVLPPLQVAAPTLVELVRPAVTLTARIRGRLGTLPSWLPADWFDDLFVQPIMAAPVFTRPMYQALDSYSRDWLLPGLATFSQPDLVTVLVSNARFLEGFLAGLSHEMGRELLWRGYPTDQRGTYFRRFWDGRKDELAQDLHRFTATALSSHMLAGLNDRVVLMVRGELIRRYPDALVLAMLAGTKDADGHPIFEDPAGNPGVKVLAPILFHGRLDPDIALVGFDLKVAEIMTAAAGGKPGWWFLIAEHPTAPRFGLREAKSGGDLRDPLGWGDLAVRLPADPARGFLNANATKVVRDTDLPPVIKATFGADSASSAHVLLRDPVRAAFEAMTLLGPTGALKP